MASQTEDNVVEKNADMEQEKTDGPGGEAEGTTMTVLVESMERN